MIFKKHPECASLTCSVGKKAKHVFVIYTSMEGERERGGEREAEREAAPSAL